MAIICACLPVCRLPLAYIFPQYFAMSARRGEHERERTGPDGDIGHREISSQSELRSWQGHGHQLQHDVAIEAGHGHGSGDGHGSHGLHGHDGCGVYEMERKYNPNRRPSAASAESIASDTSIGERKKRSSTDVGVTVYQRDRVSSEDDKITVRDGNSEDTILHVSSVSATRTRSRSNSRMGMGMGMGLRGGRDTSGDRGVYVHTHTPASPANGGGGIQMTTQFSITYDER